MLMQLLHRLVIRGFQRQIVIVLITRQKTPSFEEFRHPLADPMHQRAQFLRRGCLDAVKAHLAVDILGNRSMRCSTSCVHAVVSINPIKRENVEMNIEEQPN